MKYNVSEKVLTPRGVPMPFVAQGGQAKDATYGDLIELVCMNSPERGDARLQCYKVCAALANAQDGQLELEAKQVDFIKQQALNSELSVIAAGRLVEFLEGASRG